MKYIIYFFYDLTLSIIEMTSHIVLFSALCDFSLKINEKTNFTICRPHIYNVNYFRGAIMRHPATPILIILLVYIIRHCRNFCLFVMSNDMK